MSDRGKKVNRKNIRFPRGLTLYEKYSPQSGVWVISIGSAGDRLIIGNVKREGTEFFARPTFLNFPTPPVPHPSIDLAKQWLKEIYLGEKQWRAAQRESGARIRKVSYGKKWNQKGISKWNP